MQDNPFQWALPVDPKTGVPIVNIGAGASSVPTGGGGTSAPTTPNPFAALDAQQAQEAPQEAPGVSTPQPSEETAPAATPAPGQAPQFDEDDQEFLRVWGNAHGEDQSGQTAQFNDKSKPMWQRAGREQAPTPEETGQPQAQPQQQDKDLHDYQVAVARSKLAEDPEFGHVTDVVAPVWEAIGNTMDALRGPTGFVQEKVNDVLGRMGLDALQSPQGFNQVSAKQVFDALGIKHGYPKSYLGEGGQVVWDTAIQAMLLYSGAAEMQAGVKYGVPLMKTALDLASQGKSVLGTQVKMAAQNWAESIMANPAMHFVANELSAVGSVIGGNAAQRYTMRQGGDTVQGQVANLGGGLAGGLMGGLLAPITQGVAKAAYVGSGSRWLASKLTTALGHFLDDIGAWRVLPKGVRPERGPMPTVPDDVLDAARVAETRARGASADVVDARHAYDLAKGTSREDLARKKMNDLQQVEAILNREADEAWNKLPPRARGRYSREQTALRAQLSETAYPRAFAEDQVTGDLALVDNEIKDLMSSLTPEDKRLGLSGHSTKLAEGLWKIRAIAQGIMDKYWERAPLDQRFGHRMRYVDQIRAYRDTLHASGKLPDDIPTDDIQHIQEAFGNIREKPPTLAWVKGTMTNLTKAAYAASKRGEMSLAGSYDGLKDVLQGIVSQEFPNNVELAQARRVSQEFYNLFSDSEVGYVMRFASPYEMATRKDDVINELLKPKGGHGVADLQAAVQWIQKQGYVEMTNLTPQDRAQLQITESNMQQGIRAYIQQYATDRGQDPAAVAKFLNDPVFGRQISAMGEEAAKIQREGQQLQQLIDRRHAIEKSALAKYMKSDPDKAIDFVWKGTTNPEATAKMVIDGTAGVGGFREDPMAMEGLKSGLLDRFYDLTKGHYLQMKSTLEGPKGRVLKAVMTNDEWGRLNRIVERIGDIESTAVKNKGSIERITLFNQYMALKGLHLASKVPLLGDIIEMGEGASLKRASLVSGFAKEWTHQAFSQLPPNEVFKKAISDPEFEKLLWSKAPGSVAEAKNLRSILRRSTAVEQAITQVFRSWAAFGKGPGPVGEGEATDSPLSNVLGISPANAGESNVLQGPMPQTPQALLNSRSRGAYGLGSMVGNPVGTHDLSNVEPHPALLKQYGPRSELETKDQPFRARAENQRQHDQFLDNLKRTPPANVPGVIGPGDKVPDLERGQGPGKRFIRVSNNPFAGATT